MLAESFGGERTDAQQYIYIGNVEIARQGDFLLASRGSDGAVVFDLAGGVVLGRTDVDRAKSYLRNQGLVPDPPLAQIGTNQPITLSADLNNVGNVPLDAGSLDLKIVLQNADTEFDATIEGYGGDPAFHAVTGAQPNAAFAGVLDLRAGDVVTFALGYGENQTHYNDTSGLFARLERAPAACWSLY